MYKHYLYTPGRKPWVTDKSKDPNNPCEFCKIVSGKGKHVLYKNKYASVFMNKYPYNVGHLMVSPIKHVKLIHELSEKEFFELFKLVRKTVLLLRKVYNPAGFNIGINVGVGAGASVDHLHIHVIPRYGVDAGFLESTSSTKSMIETIEKTYKKLIKHTDILKD